MSPGENPGDQLQAMIKWKPIVSVLLFQAIFNLHGNAQVPNNFQGPEIALPSLRGDTMRLSSFSGRVVLIDFWASWCGPCRTANKNLLKVYEKYRSKGFEIFGVSLDEDLKAWANAVKKDKITWIQVNDRGGWEGGTAFIWNVSYLPTSYLINREGKILARDPDKKELEKQLKELLL